MAIRCAAKAIIIRQGQVLLNRCVQDDGSILLQQLFQCGVYGIYVGTPHLSSQGGKKLSVPGARRWQPIVHPADGG